jgi:hypothetical protein
MSKTALCLTVYICTAGWLGGCRTMPRATPRELEIRDEWAALVTPAERERVMGEAQKHTEWAERRKVRYEVDRFQHLYNAQRKKSRPTQPASKPSGSL